MSSFIGLAATACGGGAMDMLLSRLAGQLVMAIPTTYMHCVKGKYLLGGRAGC